MTRYILGRVVQAAFSLIGVTIIVFVIARVVGDPVDLLFSFTDSDAEAQKAAVRAQYHLDEPIPEQYLRFAWAAVRGDLGDSIRYQQPALELIVDKLPYTVGLAVAAASVSLMIAIPGGILAACYRRFDTLITTVCALGQSAPNFWLATLAVWIFSIKLGWFPPVGAESWKSLVLPAVVLGVFPAAVLMRLVRSALLDSLNSDYVRTARAKGLSEFRVVLRHAMRNSLLPVVTVAGLQFAGLLGGSVIIESIFAWPGVGRVMADAIYAYDFPVIQAGVIVLASIFIVLNLLVDLSYVFIDPRVKFQ